MFSSKMIIKALNIIYNSYLNEKDKKGIPKVFKLYELAHNLNTEEEKCVALLINIIDDKKIKFEVLQKEFPFNVSEAVRLLSKDDVLSYPDFIRRIKTNEIARNVKLAEISMNLKDNSNLNNEKEEFAFKLLKK